LDVGEGPVRMTPRLPGLDGMRRGPGAKEDCVDHDDDNDHDRHQVAVFASAYARFLCGQQNVVSGDHLEMLIAALTGRRSDD